MPKRKIFSSLFCELETTCSHYGNTTPNTTSTTSSSNTNRHKHPPNNTTDSRRHWWTRQENFFPMAPHKAVIIVKKKKKRTLKFRRNQKLCRAIPGEGMTTNHQPTMCNVAGSCLPCNFCTGQEAVSLGALWKNHGEKENERSRNLGEGEPIM